MLACKLWCVDVATTRPVKSQVSVCVSTQSQSECRCSPGSPAQALAVGSSKLWQPISVAGNFWSRLVAACVWWMSPPPPGSATSCSEAFPPFLGGNGSYDLLLRQAASSGAEPIRTESGTAEPQKNIKIIIFWSVCSNVSRGADVTLLQKLPVAEKSELTNWFQENPTGCLTDRATAFPFSTGINQSISSSSSRLPSATFLAIIFCFCCSKKKLWFSDFEHLCWDFISKWRPNPVFLLLQKQRWKFLSLRKNYNFFFLF